MIQHLPKPVARNKAMSRSINRVTKSHVIRRHAFRHRASRTSRLKKPACNLLPSPNLGKRAVILTRKIDLLGFFVRRLLMNNSFHARARLTQGLPRTENRQGKKAAGPA